MTDNINFVRHIINQPIIINPEHDREHDEITLIKKKVVNKLLNMELIKNDINQFKLQTILSDTDLIDDDMLTCGKISGKMLHIDIQPINITIDLSKSIGTAILHNKLSLIDRLIAKNIDIFTIQPNIIIMCVETDQDELLNKLINLGSSHQEAQSIASASRCPHQEAQSIASASRCPIDAQNYRSIYQLAAKGKLDIIKNILEKHKIPIIKEVIGKILVQAILNNHVHILQHFLTKEAFVGAPDMMFEYFMNAINRNANIAIISFFVENGIDIRQDEYKAMYTALRLGRKEIMKYFCQKDSNIFYLLTELQKEKLGLMEIAEMNQYIGTNKSCNIYYDDIGEGDKYLQCENKRHFFKEVAWKEWTKNKCEWLCPFCFCSVTKILFINKNN